MKAKKLFPDLSFKRLWDKIKDLEEKVEQGNNESNKDSYSYYDDETETLYIQGGTSNYTYDSETETLYLG